MFELIAIGMVFCLAIWIWVVLPADMARKRGRSQVGWVLVSLVGNPFLAIILLLLLGDVTRK